jgi:hypothetical protein
MNSRQVAELCRRLAELSEGEAGTLLNDIADAIESEEPAEPPPSSRARGAGAYLRPPTAEPTEAATKKARAKLGRWETAPRTRRR